MKPKVSIDVNKIRESTLKLIKFLEKKKLKMKQSIIMDN